MKALAILVLLEFMSTSVAAEAPEAILVKPLAAGAIITADDVVADEALKATIIGRELRRQMPAGAVLRNSDVRPPTLVVRNRPVRIDYAKGPLLISAPGRALSNGAKGETVRVMNLSSRSIITGVVIDVDRVKVQ
jgi:flagella basal body P-ring formation protein FlgA